MDHDTSHAGAARHAELLRRVGPAQRLRATMGLIRTTRALAEAGIRARMPGATELEVRRALVALLYGEATAARLVDRGSRR